MKSLLLLAFLAFGFVQTTQGQSTFPESGAQWYHTMDYGSFRSKVVGDTVIQGVQAKKIVQEALVKDPQIFQGLHVKNLPTLYAYTDSDTAWVYNELFNRFTPLYIFNAQEGDSICLPVLNEGAGTYFSVGNPSDSNFCFVVDSVRMVSYGSVSLKTFFTRAYTKGNQPLLNWGTEEKGAYAEKIGSVLSGFMPLCVGNNNCVSLATETLQSARELRCYYEELLSFSLVGNDCKNGGISVSVKGLEQEPAVSIRPNPAKDFIRLETKGNIKSGKVEIFNITGQSVLSTSRIPETLDVSELSSGIYFIRINIPNQSVVSQKIIIGR